MWNAAGTARNAGSRKNPGRRERGQPDEQPCGGKPADSLGLHRPKAAEHAARQDERRPQLGQSERAEVREHRIGRREGGGGQAHGGRRQLTRDRIHHQAERGEHERLHDGHRHVRLASNRVDGGNEERVARCPNSLGDKRRRAGVAGELSRGGQAVREHPIAALIGPRRRPIRLLIDDEESGVGKRGGADRRQPATDVGHPEDHNARRLG